MVHVCETMQNTTNNYSSPVPVIGLYIAAGSSICFLLILCDVWAGFRSKKYWFPCRFFSINSITLSLLSIAAKIPADLTTTMPSAQDQLSKLTGTVFICMAMVFMLPSLSINAEFESYANVTALSMFVFTVVVNICIQMATGVIFSFFVEHVIILVCMLVLLIRFWSSVALINMIRGLVSDDYKDHIRKGKKTLSERLTACYLSGYESSPQFISCCAVFIGDVALVCVMCSVVLLQSILRSLALKDLQFCHGVSDYGWSMWLVVWSQVLTIAVVSLAVGIRWLTFLPNPGDGYPNNFQDINSDTYLLYKYILSVGRFPKFLEIIFRYVIYAPLSLVNFAVMASHRFVRTTLRLGLVKCGILNVDNVGSDVWLRTKGEEDMKRWMEINRKASQLEHLTNILSTVRPSQQPFSNIGLRHGDTKNSSLSVVLLLEVTKIMKRSTPRKNLAKVLDETFDIIHFIDRKLNVGSGNDRLQSMLGHIIHQYGLPSGVPDMVIRYVLNQYQYHSSSETVCMILPTLGPDAKQVIKDVTKSLAGLIKYESRESMEVVYERIEQLFVDMLHIFLDQLPNAIFTHIVESNIEDYHERVRLCLGFLCKVESLKRYIKFSSLPPDSGITSLFDTEPSSTDTEVESPTEPSSTDTEVESPGMQSQRATDPTTVTEVEHGEIQEIAPHVTLQVQDPNLA